MAETWFTSDLHLDHKFVSGLRGFSSTEEHDAHVVREWNKRVRPNDQVWVLGDFGMGSSKRWMDTALQLNGVKHLVLGNHDACVDTTTRAVTQRGFIHVDDLTYDDKLLSVDQNLQTVWVTPSNIIRKPYNGTMVSVSNRNLQALMTPDHRVVYRKLRFKSNQTVLEDVRADELTSIHLKSRQWVTSGSGGTVDNNLTDQEIRLMAWLHTDSGVDKHGYWTFYQRESKADRIRELLGDQSYREVIRDRDITQICGKTLKKRPEPSHEFTVHAGDFSNKLTNLVPDRDRLSDTVWSMSARQVDLFIDEWVYTDGTIPTHRRRNDHAGSSVVIYCSRTPLRNDLRTLMTANGWNTSETEYRPGHWRINAYRKHTRYISDITVTETPYVGDVWCVTVPTGQFFVERGGTIHLTGNCNSSIKPANKSITDEYYKVFDTIQQYAQMNYKGTKFVLSHYPYSSDHTGEVRHNQWRLKDLGAPLIHGHTHFQDTYSVSSEGTPQLHCGWDAWGRPIPLSTLYKLYKDNIDEDIDTQG